MNLVEITSVTLTGNSGFSTATQLALIDGLWTVYLVQPPVNGNFTGLGVILPVSAPVGYLVEIHSPSAQVFPSSDATLDGSAQPNGGPSPAHGVFRKTTSSTWQTVSL